MLRTPARKGPKRRGEAHVESLAGTERLMEEVCELRTASRHYNESRPIKEVREETG